MISYQWISTILAVAITGGILFLARRNHVHFRYTVWWVFVSAGVLALGFFPRVIDWIGGLFQIGYPPILAVFMALGALLVKILTMDIERSTYQRLTRELIQRMGVLETKIEQLEDELKKKNQDDS